MKRRTMQSIHHKTCKAHRRDAGATWCWGGALKTVTASMMLVVLAGGCNELKHNPRVDEAQTRWSEVRAQVKLQLAQRTFESGATDAALVQCQEVLGLDPKCVEGLLLMARVQLEKGKYAETEAALDAASTLRSDLPEVFYLRGVLAERRGQRAAAAAPYARAYEADPSSAAYLKAYVETLIPLGRADEAVKLLNERRGDFDDEPALELLLARALAMLNQHRESSDVYLSVLSVLPQGDSLREEAGLELLAAGRLSEAELVLEPLLKPAAAPGAEMKAPLAVIRAYAGALLEAEQAADAILLLEPAVEVHAESYPLWLMLGQAYMMTGRLDRASHAIGKARQLAPDAMEVELLAAYCALAEGRLADAADLAGRVLVTHPDDAQARAILELTSSRTVTTGPANDAAVAAAAH